MEGTRKGKLRAYFFGIFICLAGFCFGYDTGIAGGVLVFDSFLDHFRVDRDNLTNVTSLVVGTQQAGALVAALGCAPLTDWLGRKKSIMLACAVFCAGCVLEVLPLHNLLLFYAGRVIAGLGLGTMYTIVPTYSAEMAPKEIRGSLGGCVQWMFTWGVLLSYWVDYAVKIAMDPMPAQWQIPLALQMLPAALLGFGLFTQKESVRWLAKKGRDDEAWSSLCWIRADDSDRVHAEFDEMIHGIRHEAHIAEEFSIKELWDPVNRPRIFIAFNICMGQQFTGATALAYFGPQFFKLVTGPGDRNLLITALFGVIKVVVCGVFVVFLAERLGRKLSLFYGAICMCVCMIITSVLVKVIPPPDEGEATPSGIATVAMIFLNIAFYNLSWGPATYPYMSEILPTRVRAMGVSIGMGAHWTFNFMFSIVTPYMIEHMGWSTFLFFAGCDAVMAIYVFMVLKETKGLSIEEMERLFHSGMGVDAVHSPKTGSIHEVEADNKGRSTTVASETR